MARDLVFCSITGYSVLMKLVKKIILLMCLLSGSAHAFESFVVKDIRLDGLHRISAGTVFSYLPVKVNESFDNNLAVKAIKALFKTGFFKDIELKREGDVLVVEVHERPSIAEVKISGNKDLDSEELLGGLKNIGLAEGRVFKRSLLEKVEQELRRQYFSSGKYGVKVKSSVSPLERNRVAVHITISEGKVAKIREINIIGNKVFKTGTLIDLMTLSTPTAFSFYTGNDQYSKQKLSADIEIIRSHYLDRGYLNFKIKSTQVSISADKKLVFITLNIDEGAQYKIKELKLAGRLIVADELVKQFTIYPGQIYSQKRVSKTTSKLSQRLGDEGYAFANVNSVPSVDEVNKEVTLTFFIDPGKRVYVRRINMTGNTKTSDVVLRREMRQMEGGWFSTKKVNRSKTRLDRLGFFEEVSLQTPAVPGTNDQIDVNYTVKERPSGNFLASVGYSQSGGVILSGSVNQNTFLGTGKRVGVGVNTSDVNTGFNVSYHNPYYTEDGVSRGFSISSQETDAGQANLSDYVTDETRATVTYGIPLNENDRVNASLSYVSTDLTVNDTTVSDQIIALEGVFDTLSIGVGWSRDTRNRAVFATRGVVHSLAAEIAIPGGDLQYYKISYNQRRYIPLTKSLTLLMRGDIGYGDAYGDTDSLPFYENYYAGGIRSVRGFRDNSLGPKDSEGDTLGGSLKTIATLELLFPPPFVDDAESVRFSLFFDAGNVFSGIDDFDVKQFRGSFGLSVSWLSPIGPLVFSFASPINDKPDDETQAFQFTLGRTL